jgi:hypothetical protein
VWVIQITLRVDNWFGERVFPKFRSLVLLYRILQFLTKTFCLYKVEVSVEIFHNNSTVGTLKVIMVLTTAIFLLLIFDICLKRFSTVMRLL